MKEIFTFIDGDLPLLVSIPHDGRELAPDQAERMTETALGLPDTDWHVRLLYEFIADIGGTVLAANMSRYVVDLNRAADDAALYAGQVSTGLCPAKTFSGEDIYLDGASMDSEEQQQRVESYWQPYHDKIASTLAMLSERHGYALLWDAHSIAGEVPLLFSGVLPDLNLGTNDQASCTASIAANVMSATRSSGFSAVLNGRFRGGFITRHYGDPEKNVHAIQLELSQRNYMDEQSFAYNKDKAQRLIATIKDLLTEFLNSARHHYAKLDTPDAT